MPMLMLGSRHIDRVRHIVGGVQNISQLGRIARVLGISGGSRTIVAVGIVDDDDVVVVVRIAQVSERSFHDGGIFGVRRRIGSIATESMSGVGIGIVAAVAAAANKGTAVVEQTGLACWIQWRGRRRRRQAVRENHAGPFFAA